MSLKLTLDLNDTTLQDLQALLAAAQSAGAGAQAKVSLEETQLVVFVSSPRAAEEATPEIRLADVSRQVAENVRHPTPETSEAALRLIADLLRGNRS